MLTPDGSIVQSSVKIQSVRLKEVRHQLNGILTPSPDHDERSEQASAKLSVQAGASSGPSLHQETQRVATAEKDVVPRRRIDAVFDRDRCRLNESPEPLGNRGREPFESGTRQQQTQQTQQQTPRNLDQDDVVLNFEKLDIYRRRIVDSALKTQRRNVPSRRTGYNDDYGGYADYDAAAVDATRRDIPRRRDDAFLELMIRKNEELAQRAAELEAENASSAEALRQMKRRLWRERTARQIRLDVTSADVRTLHRISRLKPAQVSGEDLLFATRHHHRILEREAKKRTERGFVETRARAEDETGPDSPVFAGGAGAGDERELAHVLGGGWEDSISGEGSTFCSER